MLESNLFAGNQKFDYNTKKKDLQYGVSITDACISWLSTERLLRQINNDLQI